MCAKKKNDDPVVTAMANIEKEMGGSKKHLFRPGDQPDKVDVDALSFGIPGLDKASNCKGIPRGKVIEVFGPESGGKSYVSLYLMASAQKNNENAALVDIEQSLDRAWANKQGVDVDKLVVLNASLYAEQHLEYIEKLCKSGTFSVVVVDSVASLIPKAELEGDMEKQHVGLQARVMSQALRKIVQACASTGCICVFINQLRDKVGVMFGNPETTPGGKALKFYSSMRLRIAPGKKQTIEEDNEVKTISRESYAKFVKNKVATPWGECKFNIIFDETELNPVVKMCRAAKELNLIKKHSGELKLNKDMMESPKLFSTGASTLAEVAHYLVQNDLVGLVLEHVISDNEDDVMTEDLDPEIEQMVTDSSLIKSPIDGTTPEDWKEKKEEKKADNE